MGADGKPLEEAPGRDGAAARIVEAFRRMTLRQRFLVQPVLGLLLIAFLSWCYFAEYAHQTSLLRRVADQDLDAYDRVAAAAADLTAQHLAIYELIHGANRPREEEAFYRESKRCLTQISHAADALAAGLPSASGDDAQGARLREDLAQATQRYMKAIRSAVTMSTVDLGNAAEQFARASAHFTAMNSASTKFLALERARIQAEVAARVARGEQVTRTIAIAAVFAALVLLLMATSLSGFLSRSLQGHIDALVELGDSAGAHLKLTASNEVDRAGQAVRAFGEVLRQWRATRDELEQRVADRTRALDERTRELEAANERLELQATHDRLTGLPNRALFEDRLHVAIATAERQRQTFALLYIDLDRFKAVNDTLGHAAGDRLLVIVSERLGRCVRAADTLARQGGDEFTALLTGLSVEDDAFAVAQRIIESVALPVTIGEHVVHVGASVGVAFFPRHGLDAKTLHVRADQALYAAKRAGRGAYVVYDERYSATMEAAAAK